MLRGLSKQLYPPYLITKYFAHNVAAVPAFSDAYKLDDNHIEEAIQANPHLKNIDRGFWTRSHSHFANHGFPTLNFLRIVIGNPTVLCRQPQQVMSKLEKWRGGCQFGEAKLRLLITKYPMLLDETSTNNIQTHISLLKEILGNQSNIWKLLMNSPEVMQQSEKAIRLKVEYLMQKMGLEIPEIVKSAALTQTLEDIQVRHIFQERLGLFKLKKTDDVLAKNTNSRLYKITDTSEKTFATKVCFSTLDEFHAFKELYLREIHKSDVDDNYSDDEEEDYK